MENAANPWTSKSWLKTQFPGWHINPDSSSSSAPFTGIVTNPSLVARPLKIQLQTRVGEWGGEIPVYKGRSTLRRNTLSLSGTEVVCTQTRIWSKNPICCTRPSLGWEGSQKLWEGPEWISEAAHSQFPSLYCSSLASSHTQNLLVYQVRNVSRYFKIDTASTPEYTSDTAYNPKGILPFHYRNTHMLPSLSREVLQGKWSIHVVRG